MQRWLGWLVLISLTGVLGCGKVDPPKTAIIPTPPVPQQRQLEFKLSTLVAAKTSVEEHKKSIGETPASSDPASTRLIGTPLPELMASADGSEFLNLYGPTYAGKEFHWADYRGRVVMVVFWASWCPNCKSFLPQLDAIADFVRNRSFEIVTVNVDEHPAAARGEFLQTQRVPFETIMDGEQAMGLSQEYPTTFVPTVVVANKAGNITKLDINQTDFMRDLKAMLSEPYAGTRPEIRNKPSKSSADTTAVDESDLVEAKSGVGVKGRGYGEDPATYALKARWTTEQKLIFDVQIPKAMSLFQATNERLPSSHEEFMTVIIEENGISLPQLPPGDEYVYSPQQGMLMVRPGKE